MPSIVFYCTWHILLPILTQILWNNLISTFTMRKMRLRKVTWFSQGHTGSKQLMSVLGPGLSDSTMPCCIPLATHLDFACCLWEISKAYLPVSPEYSVNVEPSFIMEDILEHFFPMCSSGPVPFSHPKLLPGVTWALGRIGTKNYMLWISPRRKRHADFIQAKSSGVFLYGFSQLVTSTFLHLALIRGSSGTSCSVEPPPSKILQSSQEAKQIHKVSN